MGEEQFDQMPDISFPSAPSGPTTWWPEGLPSVSDIFSTLGAAGLDRLAGEIAGKSSAANAIPGSKGGEGKFGKLGTIGVSLGLDSTTQTVLVIVAVVIVGVLIVKFGKKKGA